MAETNLESHGSFQKLGAIEPSCNVPGSFPQWKGAVIDRAKNNFETLERIAKTLMEKETLEKEEFEQLLKEGKKAKH